MKEEKKKKLRTVYEAFFTILLIVAIALLGSLVFSRPYLYNYSNRGNTDYYLTKNYFNNTTTPDKQYNNYTTNYYVNNTTLNVKAEYSIQWLIDTTTYPAWPNTDEANSEQVYINNAGKYINTLIKCDDGLGQCDWDILSLSTIIARTDFNGWTTILGVRTEITLGYMKILGLLWVDTDGNPRMLNMTDAGAIGLYESGRSTSTSGLYIAIDETNIMTMPAGLYNESLEITFYDNFGTVDNFTLNFTLEKT